MYRVPSKGLYRGFMGFQRVHIGVYRVPSGTIRVLIRGSARALYGFGVECMA